MWLARVIQPIEYCRLCIIILCRYGNLISESSELGAGTERVFEKSLFHQSIEHEAECDWVDQPRRLDSAIVILATVGTVQTPSKPGALRLLPIGFFLLLLLRKTLGLSTQVVGHPVGFRSLFHPPAQSQPLQAVSPVQKHENGL